jgi:hypothetical protein
MVRSRVRHCGWATECVSRCSWLTLRVTGACGARTYDRGLTDILALQSEVARAIADEIRIQVTPDERARLGHRSAVDPAAHVAYQHGLFLWNRFTGETVKQAIQRYQEALAIDPNYATAYAGLADSYIMLGKPPHPPSTRGLLTGAQGCGARTFP